MHTQQQRDCWAFYVVHAEVIQREPSGNMGVARQSRIGVGVGAMG
jgi:hypothetical protein